jgi:EmrB/QacA subfamily drug resistance transporter
MAMLDGTVVNIALHDLGESLDATVSDLQWVVNAYLLTLAAFILVGGSLGDRFGRRRIFLVGVVWFALASAVCGLAQSPGQLIGARLVQGVGAALLTPGSLAMIQGSFVPEDRGKVIGQWAGLGGIAVAIGPLLGGWLIDVAGWRLIFWINVPIAVAIIAIGVGHVPETRDPEAVRGFDLVGAGLGAIGLGAVTFTLIEAQPDAAWVGALGILALVGFLAAERRVAHPLMPLGLFTSRVFSVANGMTLLVYGALGALLFFLVLQLQVSTGYSPLEAGIATIPITILMLLFSSRSGDLAARIGPRLQMSVGPVLCGVGAFMLRGVGTGSGYWTDVLPGLLIFSAGLVTLVSPLTVSVLAAVEDRRAGIASGINNAIARSGSLLAVAALPAVVGIGGTDYESPEAFTSGYETALVVCAVLLLAGGAISFVGLTGGVAAPEALGQRPPAEVVGRGAEVTGGERQPEGEPAVQTVPGAALERAADRHAPTGFPAHDETCCVPGLPGWVNPSGSADQDTVSAPRRDG